MPRGTMTHRVCAECSEDFACPASFRGKAPKCSGCRRTTHPEGHAPTQVSPTGDAPQQEPAHTVEVGANGKGDGDSAAEASAEESGAQGAEAPSTSHPRNQRRSFVQSLIARFETQIQVGVGDVPVVGTVAAAVKSAEGQGERKKGEFRIEDSDVADQAESPPGPVSMEAPAGDACMLLDLCLKAAEQIMREVEGAKSNEEALQSLGQKAKYVKQHLLEPGAKTIHAEKYSELLQILKAAQILVATRGKSFLDRVYDAVFGRTSKVKAEIDNTREQLKDWVQLNLARQVANRDAQMDQLSLSEPTSQAEDTGEHLTYQC